MGRPTVLIAIAIFSFAWTVFAQTDAASLSGRITDQAGDILAGASVTRAATHLPVRIPEPAHSQD